MHSSEKMSDNKDVEIIKQRKRDALEIPLNKDIQHRVTTHLEYVTLIHNALPEINIDEIDTSVEFLDHKFSTPIIIDSMTGGTDEAAIINERLAEVAETFNIGMGVGSQRAGLFSKDLASSYAIAREKAPNAFLIANIGAAQLSKGITIDDIKSIISMIKANALAIHLNPLQELIQPEGEPMFKGVYDKIKEIVRSINVPVIIKEVGSGISREVAIRLELIGVKAINIAGAGGTSWAGVEKYRAESAEMSYKAHLGDLFWNWGIPTAVSLLDVRDAVKIPIIASGGLRNGLDIAKCIALGASMTAFAYPFLIAASNSLESVKVLAEMLINELKSTMFLVGANNISILKNTRYVIRGALAEWFK